MKTQILSLIKNLNQSQWWSDAEIENLQNFELTHLVRHLAKHNRYFQLRLAKQNLPPDSVNTVQSLKQLKPFTKRDIQDAGDTFESLEVPKEHLPTGEVQSSGSTGTPVKLKKTVINNVFYYAMTIRDHEWYNRDLTGKLASIRFLYEVMEADNWTGPSGYLYKTGPGLGIPVTTDIHEQLRILIKFQPNVLMAHAGVLTAFVTEWERNGLTLTELKHIKNIGDTVHDSLRERIKAITGLTLEDAYSSSELGSIAVQCPVSGLYHLMSENLIVEILDNEGNDCTTGQVGRVVVTDLYNTASPIVRYDLGDYAEVGPRCTCGRHGFTLKRIIGRERGLLTRADGTRFWPSGGQYRMLDKFNVRQWQIIQHSLDDIEYRLVTDQEPDEETKTKMAEVAGNLLGFPDKVRITWFPNSIPTKNGKFEESICLL
jgi:phenylacetate-CoA ligase